MGDKMGVCECPCGECCGTGLNESDLPDLAIANMTGSGWSAITGCCAYQDFTFDEVQPINKQCKVLREATRVSVCTHDVIGLYATRSATECPIDPCLDLSVVGTESFEQQTKHRWVQVAAWQRDFIRVWFSRLNVTCDEVETCKFVMRSEFWYKSGAYVEFEIFSNVSITASASNSCFEVVTPADCDCTGDCPLPYTVDCASYSNPSFTTPFRFVRYKLWDTLPAGTTFLTFNNDDSFPTGCTTGFSDPDCKRVEAHTTSFCIFYSTPIDPPAFCSDVDPTLTQCNLGGTISVDTDCFNTTWDGEFCNSNVTMGPVVEFDCEDYFINYFDVGCRAGCINFDNDLDWPLGGCQVTLKSPPYGAGCFFTYVCPPYTEISAWGVYGYNITSYDITVTCPSQDFSGICIASEPWFITMVV